MDAGQDQLGLGSRTACSKVRVCESMGPGLGLGVGLVLGVGLGLGLRKFT